LDREHAQNGTLVESLKLRWQNVVFSGHGRSYCACEGYLCAGRKVFENPSAILGKCIHGMDCASSQMGKLDPRTIKTYLLILDTCGSAAMIPDIWNAGHAPLAFLANRGASTAIIASDSLTQPGSTGAMDTLSALANARTIGDALNQLNRARKTENVCLPYILFGDPDLPCHAPSQIYRITPSQLEKQTWEATVKNTEPFCFLELRCVPLPLRTQQNVLLVYQPEGHILFHYGANYRKLRSSQSIVLFGHWTTRSVREAVVQAMLVPVSVVLDVVEQCERFLVAAQYTKINLGCVLQPILRLLRSTRSFLSTTTNFAPPLHLVSPRSIDARFAEWQEVWLTIQLECVLSVYEHFSKGAWPWDLWAINSSQTRLARQQCPNCCGAETLLREYNSGNHRRVQFQCRNCDILSDEPSPDGFIKFSPSTIPTIVIGETAELSLIIQNTSSDRTCLGAAVVFIEGDNHGIVVSPVSHLLRIPPNQSIEVSVQLKSNPDEALSHLYRMRIVSLLNGEWYWVSRPFLLIRSKA
jgi:hypothetical protein